MRVPLRVSMVCKGAALTVTPTFCAVIFKYSAMLSACRGRIVNAALHYTHRLRVRPTGIRTFLLNSRCIDEPVRTTRTPAQSSWVFLQINRHSRTTDFMEHFFDQVRLADLARSFHNDNLGPAIVADHALKDRLDISFHTINLP